MFCEPIGYVKRKEKYVELKGKEEIFRWDEELRSKPAEIVIKEEFCEGLEGLREGSFVWAIWYAHLAKDKPVKVRPYKDERFPEVGVFVTRSPARPCPLGLSLTYVLKVEKCSLMVTGLDAVDGTPILDLKMYYEGLDSPERVPKP